MDTMTSVEDGEMLRHNTRKSKKPLMEKRRRDRINRSLSHLKDILQENIRRNGGTKTAKLDKADILEMTVNYMVMLQYGQSVVTMATNKCNIYGYQTCSTDAVRFLGDTRVHDQKADDSQKQQPIHITIPPTNVVTSLPKPFMYQQYCTFKMEPQITASGPQGLGSALQKTGEHVESVQDRIDADDISISDFDTSQTNESVYSCGNDHEDCFRNEELKIWRPW